jgi:lipopolysaccharide/colanic/teichoic acid biosynthesis glycosyltransferase
MYALSKRIFDLAFAIVLLIISAPLMGGIALLVWLESPGNVFFCQERLGVHGRRFWLRKFRKFPAHWGDSGPAVTVRGDLRRTMIGRILERTKLDELPQLWNILKGEMSFVGPRPESLRFAHLFKGDAAGVLRHIPGLFGPTQIAFRNESQLYPADRDPEGYYQEVLFPQKARLDIEYFQKANCLTDEMFFNRFREASAAAGLRVANVRFIDRASGPTRPVKPKKALIIGLSFIGPLFIGMVLAFLLGRLDATLKTAKDVESKLGAPLLGIVPLFKPKKPVAGEVGKLVITEPGSAFTEAVRTVRTGLILSARTLENPHKTWLVASSLPYEGKSTIAMNLAFALAQMNIGKVLLIDADLRRPTLMKKFKLPPVPRVYRTF